MSVRTNELASENAPVESILPSLSALRVDDDDSVPTEMKRKAPDGPDALQKLGLELKNAQQPSVATSDGLVKLSTRLATVELTRSNYGARGVKYEDYATALFVSENSKYSDSYEPYIAAVRSGASTASLPLLEYELPLFESKSDVDTSYVEKSRAHVVKLSRDAGGTDFSPEFAAFQPFASIYVFFKLPARGADQALPTGRYLFMGRFAVQPGLTPKPKAVRMHATLKAIDTPKVFVSRRGSFSIPVPEAVRKEDDVATVLLALARQRSAG